MIQRPNAVGLLLCQQAIVEEHTQNLTLVNTFRRLVLDSFPSPPTQSYPGARGQRPVDEDDKTGGLQ